MLDRDLRHRTQTCSCIPMNAPVHMAVTRRVRPEYVEEFEHELMIFAGLSLTDQHTRGVHLLYPPPGSTEYGILRSFASEEEKEAFYQSEVFQEWKRKVAPMVEGEPEYRKLSGLEAWFRENRASIPPRWKMALLTWMAVWPVSMIVPAMLDPFLGSGLAPVVRAGIVSAGIIATLTWVAMPLLVKVARGWLHPKPRSSKSP